MTALGAAICGAVVVEGLKRDLESARQRDLFVLGLFVLLNGVAKFDPRRYMRAPQTPWSGRNRFKRLAVPSVVHRSSQQTPYFDDATLLGRDPV